MGTQGMDSNLVYRVDPIYPALARQARIQGTVILEALINPKNGGSAVSFKQ